MKRKLYCKREKKYTWKEILHFPNAGICESCIKNELLSFEEQLREARHNALHERIFWVVK
jgi:hypothetical protein